MKNHTEPIVSTFHSQRNAITIANVCCAPNTIIQQIIYCITHILHHASNKNQIAIVGDFNLDMLQNSCA